MINFISVRCIEASEFAERSRVFQYRLCLSSLIYVVLRQERPDKHIRRNKPLNIKPSKQVDSTDNDLGLYLGGVLFKS